MTSDTGQALLRQHPVIAVAFFLIIFSGLTFIRHLFE